MAAIIEVLALVDQGVDGAFAATVAGLSLAAAAFFAPSAKEFITEAQDQLIELDKKLERQARVDYDYADTPYSRKCDELKAQIAATLKAQKSLLKAFFILCAFVAYSISLDQLIEEDLVRGLLPSDIALGLIGGDVAISSLLLAWAGKNLLSGTRAIGTYFDVSFEEEMKQVKELRYLISKISAAQKK